MLVEIKSSKQLHIQLFNIKGSGRRLIGINTVKDDDSPKCIGCVDTTELYLAIKTLHDLTNIKEQTK